MFWSLFFIYLFLIITFGYSAFEKIVNFKTSVNYYKNYFKGIFISGWIYPLLLIITVIEFVTTLFLCIGIYELWILPYPLYGFYGLVLSSSTLLCFLLGQRLAKDYDGARGIAIYFIICLIGFISASL